MAKTLSDFYKDFKREVDVLESGIKENHPDYLRMKKIFKVFNEIYLLGLKIEKAKIWKAAEKANAVRLKTKELMEKHVSFLNGCFQLDCKELIDFANIYIKYLNDILNGRYKYCGWKAATDFHKEEIKKELQLLESSVDVWQNKTEQLTQREPVEAKSAPKESLQQVTGDLNTQANLQTSPARINAELAYQISLICKQDCKYHSNRLYYLFIEISTFQNKASILALVEDQIKKKNKASGVCCWGFFHRLGWTFAGQSNLRKGWVSRGDNDDYEEKLQNIRNLLS